MACRILFPLIVSFLAFCISYSSARTAAEWKSRVVYQVVTDRFASTGKSPTTRCLKGNDYCYGTFKGIQRNLDYIAGLGVNAIWISPFTLNTNDSAGNIDYFGRWPLDIYQINPYFGTPQDLIALVDACHSRDIWVMADLVIRNMGYQDGCRSNSCPYTDNFDKFKPFNKSEHYDERSKWVENLPKLNHTNSFVRSTLIYWVQELSRALGFDGFRLDNVDEISEEFLEELNNSTQIFMIGQTSKTESELAEYQHVLDSVFDGDMNSKLNAFFEGSGGSNGYYRIPDALSLRRAWFTDAAVLGGYIDNHDESKRFLNEHNGDYTKLRNALAYLLMAEWIPFIYYGTEQGDSLSYSSSLWPFYVEERSLYQFISTILKHRKNLFGSAVSDYQNVAQVDCSYGTTFYSFTRKTTFVIISNQGYSSSAYTHLIRNHPFDEGTELVNIFDSTDKVTVQENGTFYVTLENGEPKIYSGGSHIRQSLLLVVAIYLLILYEKTKL